MSQNNSNPNTAEGQGTNDSTPLSYKQQLDQAALKVKNPPVEDKGGVVNQVVEKGEITVQLLPGLKLTCDVMSKCPSTFPQ